MIKKDELSEFAVSILIFDVSNNIISSTLNWWYAPYRQCLKVETDRKTEQKTGFYKLLHSEGAEMENVLGFDLAHGCSDHLHIRETSF